MSLTTIRYALSDLPCLQFTVVGISTLAPPVYERQMHVHQGKAEGWSASLIVSADPGSLLGGRRCATPQRHRSAALEWQSPLYLLLMRHHFFAILFHHMTVGGRLRLPTGRPL